MAAALAIGGKDQMMYIHQKLQGREIPSASAVQLNNTSPITPVNMMGSPAGHENMMLPPPPRFPTGTMHAQPNYFQQHPMMQTQWSQPQAMNQVHSPNTQQHLSWIQQMNAACLAAQQQQAVQPQMQDAHMTSPSPIPNATVSQPQQIQSMQFQQPQIQHQIQVGVDGATVPVMAIANPDGTVSYHIDPNSAAVPQAGLRYLTKAINEVVKPEDPEKEDPAVLAEKRQRRLARNRESARQSRRRKKDHLNNLAEKVKKLQRLLDIEIAAQIKSMESGKAELKAALLEKSAGGANTDKQSLGALIQSTSPNCSIRSAVISHQYNCLRQAFLSTQNHFSVWLMMKNEQFFADGCRASKKTVESKGSRTAISRPNSKQGGEDIINNEKTGDRLVSSNAEDAPRMWPLLCHELTLTMDQEERIVNQAHVE
jgi:translation initiation factor 2 beta subunit (eIF-2beta)/eIF-5